MSNKNKLEPTTIYTLTEKDLHQAITDYIIKHSDKNFIESLKLTYMNGSVVEKPLFTSIKVRV